MPYVIAALLLGALVVEILHSVQAEERYEILISKLNRILERERTEIKLEVRQMSLGQDILDSISAEKTSVDSFIALVNGLLANNTIDATTADAIKAAIAAQKAEIDAAIIANTTPPVTPAP